MNDWNSWLESYVIWYIVFFIAHETYHIGGYWYLGDWRHLDIGEIISETLIAQRSARAYYSATTQTRWPLHNGMMYKYGDFDLTFQYHETCLIKFSLLPHNKVSRSWAVNVIICNWVNAIASTGNSNLFAFSFV